MTRKLVIEIPLPNITAARFSSWRQHLDLIASEKLYLFLSLILLIVSSLYTIYYHTIELDFIDRHYASRESRASGFELYFGHDDIRKISWLPVLFYRSPHHQLAIAASYACIALSVIVCFFYLFAPWIKNSRTRLAILATFYIPTISLAITAFLYNFIEAAQSARVDTWALHEYASPTKYDPYGSAWMDLESWTCGVRYKVLGHIENGRWTGARGVLESLCDTAIRGRWMLVPLVVVLLVSAEMSWVVFRAEEKAEKRETAGTVRDGDMESGKARKGGMGYRIVEEGEDEAVDAETRPLLRDEEDEDAERRPASDERVRLP